MLYTYSKHPVSTCGPTQPDERMNGPMYGWERVCVPSEHLWTHPAG